MEPFQYIASVPGKDIRARLIDAFNAWLNISADKLDVVKGIVSKLHNASLMIDDIEDNSKLRRGVPVAHHIYGIAATINSANYVYFETLKLAHDTHNPRAINAFVDEMLNLHHGQGLDIYWRDNHRCPSEEEYAEMVIQS